MNKQLSQMYDYYRYSNLYWVVKFSTMGILNHIELPKEGLVELSTFEEFNTRSKDYIFKGMVISLNADKEIAKIIEKKLGLVGYIFYAKPHGKLFLHLQPVSEKDKELYKRFK